MRHRETGDHRHAEAGRNQGLHGDVVVGSEVGLRTEPGLAAGMTHDPEPSAVGRSPDPRFISQIFEPERASSGEWMTGGQDGLELIVEKRDPLEPSAADLRQRDVFVDDGQIQLPGLQPRDEPVQVVVDDGQSDVGVQAAEPRESCWHERAQHGREATETEPATPPLADLGEFLLRRVEPSQDAGRVSGQGGAGFGQVDRAGTSLHHGQPEFAFQSRDVLADRRLGQPQSVRRSREASLGRDLGEHVKTPDVEHKHYLYSLLNQYCNLSSGRRGFGCQSGITYPDRRTNAMPLINVKLIENVFTADQKHDIVERLTDAMVTIEGENMRAVTWVVIEEVKSGDWGIGGNALTTADVKALAAAVPA